MFFLKRNRMLLTTIKEYLFLCDSDIALFHEAILYYLSHGNDVQFKDFMERIDRTESQADDVLHSIENVLYAKSLLPESREDLKTLLERYDDIVDSSNHILKFLYTRSPSIPAVLHDDITKMLVLTHACYDTVHNAIEDLLGKREMIVERVRAINGYETQCDEFETHGIRQVFSSECDGFTKLIAAEFFTLLSKLTDYCEACGSYITIMNIKRVI